MIYKVKQIIHIDQNIAKYASEKLSECSTKHYKSFLVSTQHRMLWLFITIKLEQARSLKILPVKTEEFRPSH